MTVVDITGSDPFINATADLIKNPYPYYEQIRQQGNVVWSSAGEKRWIAVGYKACVTMLNDSRFSVEPSEESFEELSHLRHSSKHADLITGLTKFMLAQDPPQHT